MKTVLSLNFKLLSDHSKQSAGSKEQSVASAMLLKSFYREIGSKVPESQPSNYWVIKKDRQRYQVADLPIRTRRFEYDYYLRNDLPSIADKDKQFAFTIWRNIDRRAIPERNSWSNVIPYEYIVSQVAHTFWICEGDNISYSELLRSMVRTFLIREVDPQKSVFSIAQKGVNKIAFFVQNINFYSGVKHPPTDQDRLDKEQGESIPIAMDWNRFIPFHPFDKIGTLKKISRKASC